MLFVKFRSFIVIAAVENGNMSADKKVYDNSENLSSSWNNLWVRQAWNMKAIKSSQRLATRKSKEGSDWVINIYGNPWRSISSVKALMPRAVRRFFDCITKKMKTKLFRVITRSQIYGYIEFSGSISSHNVATCVISTGTYQPIYGSMGAQKDSMECSSSRLKPFRRLVTSNANWPTVTSANLNSAVNKWSCYPRYYRSRFIDYLCSYANPRTLRCRGRKARRREEMIAIKNHVTMHQKHKFSHQTIGSLVALPLILISCNAVMGSLTQQRNRRRCYWWLAWILVLRWTEMSTASHFTRQLLWFIEPFCL